MSTANRVTVETDRVARTRALGRRLARLLHPGDVVLLQGPLGAGKTVLAQGIGAGLKVETQVASPTFVLLARHEGPVTLYHADLYRLGDADEVAELALGEQAMDGVLLVEWPERGLEVLPEEHLFVAIEPLEGEPNGRRLTFVASGERYRQVLDGLNAGGRG